ncbi:ketopantoate reductase family protein [Ovoidimarina sediminis]|uniref:ketopantoate reductase family protein n=1 Tax=Ovoidimarina sediminis TaxID=3079856 RepID=UPI002914B39F|nr:2-dehydropantoate 2-reductase [Rhodophyticola sp. MJ-SS7]MDU8943066.1 2-dehydropantoate 2-reductase [Rhodophyticola sp. MJ-SS7]
MDIAIVGAGGIGGYLAAKLTSAGRDVKLLARGTQLAAIRENGLHLIEPEGDLTITPATLTDDAREIGQPDLIIMAVKAHQLEDAIEQVRPAVGDGTRLLPFQNGVDAPDMLARAFGKDRALIGVSRFFANITAPGVITRYGAVRGFTVGAMNGTQSPVQDIIALFRNAGIESPDHPDVRIDLWAKLVLFNAASSLTAGTRKRFGTLRDTPETAALARRLMQETWEVGRAEGVPLPEAMVADTFRIFMEVVPADGRTSTAHDLEAGRPLEIDFTCGAVARRGRALGVDVTASETVYALLAPWREGG